MPLHDILFKRNKASTNSSTTTPTRYPPHLEQAHPLVPPSHNPSEVYGDRHASDPRLAYEEASSPNPQSQPHPELLAQQSSSLHRSLSQRQHQPQPQSQPTQTQPQPQQPQPQQRDRQSVAPEDPQPRRRRGLLGARPASGINFDRSPSISKGRHVSHPISQPTSPQHLKFQAEQQDLAVQPGRPEEQQQQHDQSPVAAPPYEPRSASLAYQHQHLQHSQRSLHQSHPSISSDIQDWSPSPSQQHLPQQQPSAQSQLPGLQLPRPPTLERCNTDPTLVSLHRTSARPSPTDRTPDSPRYLTDNSNRGSTHSRDHDLVLNNSRPPSRQTYEPHSPSQNHPDAMQQAAQAPSGQPATDRPGQHDASRRGSTAQTNAQTMPEQQSRNTPSGSRTRDDLENLDIRALIQKHDELQSKYSKVKRYYFEKEAQVQHLQNTVAHQRMAVSRTVLDDNEYTNRFQRLDGAIKDLAFSVRKDWRGIPPWLHGLTTDDAVSVGTKEMMALGRAVVSRWLTEEVFQKHFHPGLEPGLSEQLKKIEMNLRRQQMRPVTDEDRENAIAKLSNWRRTTFDGLGDLLASPIAQEHRAELIEHLIVELATFLSSQLQDQALPGLEAGVRMIIENTINIIEKIPLEARDVCVEYFPPNISYHDTYMKVEGQLPPLTHQPPPPAEQDYEEEGESSPGSNSTGAGGESASPATREPRRRSVFGALMGRRPGTEAPNRASTGEKGESTEPARIRFASFLTVEVRGKGPATVLIKAPVFLIE